MPLAPCLNSLVVAILLVETQRAPALAAAQGLSRETCPFPLLVTTRGEKACKVKEFTTKKKPQAKRR